jgi:hypothetical protein
VSVPPVHQHTGEGGEHQRRDLTAESYDAEQQGRPRESIHEPARGDARDPRPDERDALAAEEEAEVARGERAGDARVRQVTDRARLESGCGAKVGERSRAVVAGTIATTAR